jgi:transposase
MPTYSTEFKDNIVRKMMPPISQSVEQICKEIRISRSSLYALMQVACGMPRFKAY